MDNSRNNQPMSWRLFIAICLSVLVVYAVIARLMEGEDFSPTVELLKGVVGMSIGTLAFWILRRIPAE